MGKPQSFKDIFKTKRQVPFTQKPLTVPTSSVPKISPQEEARRIQAKKDLTKFVNGLSCTVCGAQLDGGVTFAYAELYCVQNNVHFKCRYNAGETQPEWTSAVYNFADEAPEGYQVNSSIRDDKTYRNWIYKLDLNLVEKFRMRDKKLSLSVDGAILKFPKNLSYKDFVQKLKLYAVFS